MATGGSERSGGVRYQPDEKPPAALAAGLGIQLAVLCIAGVALTPAIVVRAAGGAESYLTWAVFAAVLVSGVTSVLQARRLGRIGAGYVLVMGTSGAFIAICVAALALGGPGMLAILVVISSLFQFLLAWRLSLLRRILTPTVAGTVIMLIPVTVMPIVFGMLTQAPPDTPALGAPLSALVTVLIICAIALKAQGALRLWAPVIGIVGGCGVAGYFGLYEVERIVAASWVGLPEGGWPGFDVDFGPVFWGLLPAFVFVTLVGAIETVGDGVAIQRVSWRKPRAVDFRAVQGAVTADGVGNLLSGLMGTVPNTTYSTSISVTALTGVGARSVGIALGICFVAVAFIPKALAVVLAIPGPVAAAYITLLLALLFVVGMRIVVQDGLDYRKGLVAGVAFWIGVGFQNGVIFPELVSGIAGGLLENGMTAGGLVAILLTLFMEVTAPRRRRLQAPFEVDSLPRIRDFLQSFASRNGWSAAMAQRLDAAAEEALLTLLREDELADEAEDEDAGEEEGPRGTRAPAPAAHRPQGGRRRGAGIHRGAGRREPRGPDGHALGADRRRTGGTRGLAQAAAPPRVVGPSPAVPRHRHPDGPRGRAGGGPGLRLSRGRRPPGGLKRSGFSMNMKWLPPSASSKISSSEPAIRPCIHTCVRQSIRLARPPTMSVGRWMRRIRSRQSCVAWLRSRVAAWRRGILRFCSMTQSTRSAGKPAVNMPPMKPFVVPSRRRRRARRWSRRGWPRRRSRRRPASPAPTTRCAR